MSSTIFSSLFNHLYFLEYKTYKRVEPIATGFTWINCLKNYYKHNIYIIYLFILLKQCNIYLNALMPVYCNLCFCDQGHN